MHFAFQLFSTESRVPTAFALRLCTVLPWLVIAWRLGSGPMPWQCVSWSIQPDHSRKKTVL